MKIIILSHERSLNKTEAILKTFANEEVYLIIDNYPPKGKKEHIEMIKFNERLPDLVQKIQDLKMSCLSAENTKSVWV